MLVLLIILLLLPVGYLYRYQALAALANVVLILLHIFSIIPDPRYKSSHKIGIYTELDLISHYEDVIDDNQRHLLLEYRKTLIRLGKYPQPPPDLDEDHEYVTFTREFHQKHNNSSNRSQGSNINMSHQDIQRSKKQQQVVEKAFNVASTGLAVGATFTVAAATGFFQYASQYYTSLQPSNEEQEKEKPLLASNISSANQTQSLTQEPSIASLQTLQTNGNSSLTATVPITNDVKLVKTSPQYAYTPSISNGSHPQPDYPLHNIHQSDDELNFIEQEGADTLVDSLQKSVSSLFSTFTITRQQRKSIQQQQQIGHGMGSKTLPLSNSTSSNQLDTNYLNTSLTSHSMLPTTTPTKPSRFSIMPTPALLGAGMNDLNVAEQHQSLPSASEFMSGGYYPDLRSRLTRLSNQPQQNNIYQPQNDIYQPQNDILAMSTATNPTTLTSSTAISSKRRVSYAEKYKKLEDEREKEKKNQNEQMMLSISSQIRHSRQFRKLEQLLHSFASIQSGQVSKSSSGEATNALTISYRHFFNTITSSNLFHSLSRTGQLQMSMALKYKQNIPNLDNSSKVGQATLFTNVPLLAFRFVDFNTIQLVLIQFGYVCANEVQPQVMLTTASDGTTTTSAISSNNSSNSKDDSTKSHPTLNTLTSSTSPADVSNTLFQMDLDSKNDDALSTQITPLLVLSSTLTKYTVYDMVYILNNFQFDKDIQKDFLHYQNSQLNHQAMISHEVSKEINASTTTLSPNGKTNMKTVLPHKNLASITTLPQLFDCSRTNSTQSQPNSLFTSPNSNIIAGNTQNNANISANSTALLLSLLSLSHVVPGRRRSLYNAPVTTSTSDDATTTNVDDDSTSIAQKQTAINSLHHSLFLSLVVDTDIYDLICLTAHQRDIFVEDLQQLVLGLVQSTSSTDSSTNNDAISSSTPANQNNEIQGTVKGGYTLRNRK